MYDLIIIGSGAAGMSAALYAGRGGLKTLVIEKGACGGQVLNTNEIDNYPGIDSCPNGFELAQMIENHAKKFGAEFLRENVKSVENAEFDVKVVRTRKNTYMTKAIIFATGAHPKALGAEGEKELTGSGVSYCATCDGAFFKDKTTAVIGGGNTAFEDALYLAGLCEKVYIINRSKKFRANKPLVDQAVKNGKIEIITDTVVERFTGLQTLDNIRIKNTVNQKSDILKVQGAFVAIGVEPNSDLAEGVCERCERGFIKTDIYLRTSTRGIFAAGDVRTTPLRQVITAAADGAVAATSAINYINELGIKNI